MINGDVESNPGPISSVESYRVAIGRYYNKARFLSNRSDEQINVCACNEYEDYVFKLTGYNLLTMLEFFNDEYDDNVVLNLTGCNNDEQGNNVDKFTEKDLEFCIAAIELIYDVSFLKLKQLIACGDVEINPGPVNMNCDTPKSKGGRPKKGSKGFKGCIKTI